jgi:2-methyl-3-hydroxypyridine 5-carboxylic acid dioxygenase
MAVRRAEIAGAGFAGLTAAIALAQRGWAVRVHEAAPELRAFGAGIFLWENGLRVLEEIGALGHVLAGSYEAPAWEERTADGTLLGSRPFPLPGGGRMVTLTRQRLHDALVSAARVAGVRFETGSRVLGADPEGGLLIGDGAVTADVVIGADGIRSSVRDSVDLLDDRSEFEVGVYRVLVDRALAPSHTFWRNYVNFWDTERKRRILYVPCAGADLYLLLGAKSDDAEALRAPFDRRPWQESYPLLARAIAGVADEPRFDFYERVRLKRWSTGRVAVVGDAAHAMPPTLGQGAGTAMSNALSLAVHLDSTDDVATALRNWEATARVETDRVQQVSVDRIGELFPENASGVPTEWDAEEISISERVPQLGP